jgi:hypothetical protein
MTNSTSHFTAAQVLQAARRAEAEGKFDYALQFYRHLTDHYPDAPEAHEAREGLQRIGNWQWGAQTPPGAAPAAAVGAPPDRSLRQPGALRGGRQAAPPPAAGEMDEAPDPYRIGRLASRALGVIGGLVALAGLVYAAYFAWTGTPEQWAESPIGFPLVSLWSLVTALAGFALFVASHVASALFDGAEALAGDGGDGPPA